MEIGSNVTYSHYHLHEGSLWSSSDLIVMNISVLIRHDSAENVVTLSQIYMLMS